jgi:branched-subunit amino acid transport protein
LIEGAAKLWLLIAIVGASNYLARLSFIALLANARVPPLARRALRFVAVSMIAALVVPMVVGAGPLGSLQSNPRVPAAIVAAAVAWFTRSTGWTLATGMGALWTLQALLDK